MGRGAKDDRPPLPHTREYPYLGDFLLGAMAPCQIEFQAIRLSGRQTRSGVNVLTIVGFPRWIKEAFPSFSRIRVVHRSPCLSVERAAVRIRGWI